MCVVIFNTMTSLLACFDTFVYILDYLPIESIVYLYATSKQFRELVPLDKVLGKWTIYTKLLEYVYKKGYQVVIYGGAVRDHIMGYPINNLDMIIYNNSLLSDELLIEKLFPCKNFKKMYTYSLMNLFHTKTFKLCGVDLSVDVSIINKEVFAREHGESSRQGFDKEFDFDVNSLVYIHPYVRNYYPNFNGFISRKNLSELFLLDVMLNGSTKKDLIEEIRRHLFNDNKITASYLLDCLADTNLSNDNSVNAIIQNIKNKTAILNNNALFFEISCDGDIGDYIRLYKLLIREYKLFYPSGDQITLDFCKKYYIKILDHLEYVLYMESTYFDSIMRGKNLDIFIFYENINDKIDMLVDDSMRIFDSPQCVSDMLCDHYIFLLDKFTSEKLNYLTEYNKQFEKLNETYININTLKSSNIF